jgi:arginyl-tRNA synthetase
LTNPFHQFHDECRDTLQRALGDTFPDWVDRIPRLSIPPSLDFGELSSSIAHEIATAKGTSPGDVARTICKTVTLRADSWISNVSEAAGYVNFKLNYEKAAPLIFESVFSDEEHYGIEITDTPERIAVEHTSANPSGPLTMGHARNSILGDALARLLVARGHRVKRRFYVDDVGRQVSILAYGFRLLGNPAPEGKADTWLGQLYASTNCAVQIKSLKKQLANGLPEEERLRLQKELDEWIGIAAELDSTHNVFSKVVEAVKDHGDPDVEIQAIGREYERKDEGVVKLVRQVAQLALDGIRASLSEMGILFDNWDWESNLIWDGDVNRVIDRILKLPFTSSDGSSVLLDVKAIVEAYALRDQFHLSPHYEVPSLTLIRSDGTTL